MFVFIIMMVEQVVGGLYIVRNHLTIEKDLTFLYLFQAIYRENIISLKVIHLYPHISSSSG